MSGYFARIAGLASTNTPVVKRRSALRSGKRIELAEESREIARTLADASLRPFDARARGPLAPSPFASTHVSPFDADARDANPQRGGPPARLVARPAAAREAAARGVGDAPGLPVTETDALPPPSSDARADRENRRAERLLPPVPSRAPAQPRPFQPAFAGEWPDQRRLAARDARHAEAAVEPAIHIRIGRIDVTAAAPARDAIRRTAPAAQPSALDTHLRARDRGAK